MQATATQASAPTLLSQGIAAGLSIRPFFNRSQFLAVAVASDPKNSEEAWHPTPRTAKKPSSSFAS